jgi:hypothetical protein
MSLRHLMKPVNDKFFPARVYDAEETLPVAPGHDSDWVLASEPVEWEIEYRAFVLDAKVKTLSIYRAGGSAEVGTYTPSDAAAFCARVLSDALIQLPQAVVLDVGTIRGRGWAIVEANAANMCSIYDCDPEQVLAVLSHGITPAPTPSTLEIAPPLNILQ